MSLGLSSTRPRRVWAGLVQSAAALAHGGARLALGAFDTLETWLERAEQRRRLRDLNDHMLRDIGLDRGAAWREANKRFFEH